MAYLQWLGLLPRERLVSKSEFRHGRRGSGRGELVTDPETETLVDLKGTGRQAKVVRAGREVKEAVFADSGKEIAGAGLAGADRVAGGPAEALGEAQQVDGGQGAGELRRAGGGVQAPVCRAGCSSTSAARREFGDPVIDLILDRIPIALYFGILSTLIIYGVCLPLGVVKAIKHRTPVDNLSSVLIFVGYAIPGFALGAVMLVYLGARTGWFPMIGLESPDADSLDAWGQIKDRAHHTVLPLICYVIGGFAWLTMMMKNNLMDNLAADYVRTAVAKGVSFHRAVFRHAFRNSFIPIASTLGQLITHVHGRQPADRVGLRHPGIRPAAVPGAAGPGPDGDHGDADDHRLPDAPRQRHLRHDRGHRSIRGSNTTNHVQGRSDGSSDARRAWRRRRGRSVA